MTKLSPQYQAWRRAGALEYGTLFQDDPHLRGHEVVAVTAHIAGAEAEHEAAKLLGRLEALEEIKNESERLRSVIRMPKVGHSAQSFGQDWAYTNVVEEVDKLTVVAQARLDALLRGGGEG